MRILAGVVISALMLLCHNSSASRIDIQATPRTVYPVLTKTLQLRCAVQKYFATTHHQYTTHTDYVLSSRSTTTRKSTTTTTKTTASAPTTNSVKTHTTALSTLAEVSHIISIIVSRSDPTTGRQQTVATLSSFDPLIANTDSDKITVDGDSESSPIAGEQGYLTITWEYPVSAQAGIYTCEVFAVDSTLHPLFLSESVQVTASEPTVPELATIVAQNDKYITELRKTVSDLKNQTSALKLQSQEYLQTITNITEIIQSNLAQNIQTGRVNCNNRVTFPKPYNSLPVVLFVLSSFQYYGSSGSAGATITALSETGFTPSCNSFYGSTELNWIAFDY